MLKDQPLLIIKAVQVRKVLNSHERFKVFVGKTGLQKQQLEDGVELL
jgi:hypothetical protein